jgi:hypothetical protein
VYEESFRALFVLIVQLLHDEAADNRLVIKSSSKSSSCVATIEWHRYNFRKCRAADVDLKLLKKTLVIL